MLLKYSNFILLFLKCIVTKLSLNDIKTTVHSLCNTHNDKSSMLSSSIVNPIFGYLFETTGALSNFRFHGPDMIISKRANVRDFSEDQSLNMFTKLFIEMFPSPTGIFTHVRNKPTNFGFKFDKFRPEGIEFLAKMFVKILKFKEKEHNVGVKEYRIFRKMKRLLLETKYQDKILDFRIIKLMAIHAFILNAVDSFEELEFFLSIIIENIDINDPIEIYELDCDIIDEVIKIQEGFKEFPYSELNQPPTNIAIPIYDREKCGTYEAFSQENNFSDCAEIVLLNICNCLLFNPNTLKYSIEGLDQNSDLAKFYEKHNKLFTITKDIRNDWSEVVQGLEDFKTIDNSAYKTHMIVYLKEKRNELKSGIINMINVLIKIFKIDHKDFWSNFTGKNIDRKLKDLFDQITPSFANRTVIIETKSFKTFNINSRTEFCGAFQLIFELPNTNKITFSVEENENHAEASISSYVRNKKYETIDLKEMLDNCELPLFMFKNYVAISQNNILRDHSYRITDCKFFERLYFLKPIHTNTQIQNVLKTICDAVITYFEDNLKLRTKKHENVNISKTISNNMLETIDLTDPGTRSKFLPFLLDHDLNENETIESWIKALKISDSKVYKHWEERVLKIKPKSMSLDLEKFPTSRISELFKTIKKCKLNKLHVSRIDKEQQETFFNYISTMTELNHLDLSSNYLTFSRAKYLIKILENLENLTSLNLWGNQIGIKGLTEISTVLQTKTKLKSLTLSYNSLNSKTLNVLPEILRNLSNLEYLDLSNNCLNSKTALEIMNALTVHSKLKYLNLSDNQLGLEGAKLISSKLCKLTNLESLDISVNFIEVTGANLILDALKNPSKITNLNISRNRLDGNHHDFEKMANKLKDLSNLTHLDISATNLKLRGAEFISRSLLSLPNLKKLNLSDSELNNKDCESISKAFKTLINLEDLNISKNPVNEEGAKYISEALCNMPNLTILKLSENNLKSSGLSSILEAFPKLKNLKNIDISQNNLRLDASQSLADAISKLDKLESIDISRNYIEIEGETILKKAAKQLSKLNKIIF